LGDGNLKSQDPNPKEKFKFQKATGCEDSKRSFADNCVPKQSFGTRGARAEPPLDAAVADRFLDYVNSKGVRESAMAKKAAKKTTGSKSKPKATSKGRSAKPKAKKRPAKKGVVAKVAGSIASAVASVMPGGKKKK
jgi:hypothetical protein